MAINYTYPVKGQPVIEDEFLIVDTQDGNATKRVTVDSILDLGSGGDIGVSTFQATDGTFINYSPNGATTGTVTLTGDLSATGTPGATNFLRGDNTWSTAIREVNPGIGEPIAVSTTDGIAELSLSTVPIAKGGTNLTALGTAFQVMGVNSGGDALAYTDVKVSETVVADEAIAKGDPLYISNDTGGNVHVSKADAGDALKMPAVGLASEDISNGATGTMHIVGLLEDVRNNDIPSTAPNPVTNDIIYVANGGGLTSIKPTGTNLIQNVAIVVKTGNSGSLQITAIGRSNDVPNIPSTQVWVGSSTGVATPRTLTGEVTVTNTGVTEVTGIDGNVSIQGYSPVENLSDTNVILTDEYFGKTLILSDAATEVTITDNIAYPIGTEINLINSDGQTTISAPSGGGTLNGDTNDVTIQVAYGQATLKKIASNNYVIYGDLA